MKFAKRMLATLLTFALALSLALPTMAAVNWNEFRIVKKTLDLDINHGERFTLSVEVNVPDGVEEVEYQWEYRSYLSATGLIENATSPELTIEADSPYYPGSNKLGSGKHGGTWAEYRCQVTAYEKDNGGNIISSRVITSNYVRVTRTRTFQEKLYSVILEPWARAFGGLAVYLSLSWFTLLPVSPVLFLGLLIYYYGKNFIALF